MEPFLRDLQVWCWRYLDSPRNYPGVHFTARPEACDALLRCLDVMEAHGAGSRRTIPLRDLRPGDEAKISGGMRFEVFSKLRLCLSQKSSRLQQMYIHADDGILLVEIVKEHVPRLRKGFEDVREGVGDYAIAPQRNKSYGLALGNQDKESLQLWFWPCFGHLRPVK